MALLYHYIVLFSKIPTTWTSIYYYLQSENAENEIGLAIPITYYYELYRFPYYARNMIIWNIELHFDRLESVNY